MPKDKTKDRKGENRVLAQILKEIDREQEINKPKAWGNWSNWGNWQNWQNWINSNRG